MSYKINYSVYKITNIITNQHYIGVDSYFPKRLKQHQSLLLKNKNKNKYLQSSYNKYGFENFTFELLENCETREIMLNTEINLISKYNSLENGYNHTIGGEGSFGYKHSEESISKMSSWKRVITSEWCEAISKATLGKKKKEGIKRINHPNYNNWLGGEKHPVAKLKQSEVNNIRLQYLNGVKQRDLAKTYFVTNIMINAIVVNRNWIDKNYEYIKKSEFKNNIEMIEKMKKYLYENISFN